MGVVLRLERAHFDGIVEVLSNAFRDYPVMRYILGDPGDDYELRLAALVGYFTESRFARDYPVLGIESDGRLVAAANINPPRSVPAPPELKRCYERLGETIGSQAMTRFQAFADACEPLEPTEPHYYLGMIGVARSGQGKGYARVLLDALHQMSDRDDESTGICLTTELPSNVELYEYFGYRTLGRAVTADGQLESWTMFRPRG